MNHDGHFQHVLSEGTRPATKLMPYAAVGVPAM
jgi:hypothetical protein